MFFRNLRLLAVCKGAAVAATVLCAGGTPCALAAEEAPAGLARFAEGSPEFAALSAASKYIDNDAFTLRQDYWQGALTAVAGKAIRLQFFPHMKYRLFLAAGEGSLPKGGKLHVRIMDRGLKEVATASTRFQSTVAQLKFEPKETGLYMVLMRLEAPGEADKDVRVPCVLFYGYE